MAQRRSRSSPATARTQARPSTAAHRTAPARTTGWAAYGRRVYIAHEHDGHSYTTMYAHLDSVSVSAGQKVKQGDLVGTLGQSCNEAESCGNFSTPHLHFALHRDANFGGSGSGGSYGGLEW